MLEFLAAIERHLMTIRRLLAGSTSLTDDQLRATPIDVSIVSGTVTIGSELEITNDVGNPISISASTLPLPTDAATETTLGTLLKPADTLNKVNTLDTITNQVTVNVGLTDAELRATPVPVSVTGMGDATAANQTTIIGHLDGVEALLTTIDADTSTLAGIDYATETTVNTLLKPADTLTAVTTVGTITNVVHVDDNGGSLTVDGTVTANLGTIAGIATEAKQDTQITALNSIDTKLTNPISIDDNGGSITVDGTVSLGSGVATIGTVEIGATSLAALETINAAQSGTWDINNISGTINLPTGAATETTLSAINTKLTEGQDVMANSIPVVIASNQSSIPITDNGGSLTVDGTVDVGNFPVVYPINDNGGSITIDGSVSISGTPTVVLDATSLSALESITVQNGAGASAVNIQDGGNSITIDAASLPLPSGASTEATLATVETNTDYGTVVGGGTEATALRVTIANDSTGVLSIDDNGSSITVDGTITANLGTIAGVSTEATLATVETNTDYGTVTGGGTEASALRVTIASDSTGVLSIDDNGGSITIDGSITANAGSNLNTSALALETTLQSVKTAVEIIDNAISGNEMQVDVLTLPTISPDLASINFDAGGRQRISQLYTLGDYKILNADRTLLIETAGTGTGNFTNNTYTMTVTDGQYLIRQSKRYHPYLSGKSQLVELTFDNFDIQANVIKRIGYFSSNAVAPYASTFDGIYLENDGTDIRFRITNAGTTVINVTQANWNVNTLGGHDWSKFNVILIDFLWLGGAVVRLYVKTSTGFQLCHVYTHAGAADGTMTLSPNQPVRYEIRGNGAGGTMTYVCAQVSTEGSIDESGSIIGLSHSSTGIALSAIGTIYPLIGVRKKSTHRDVALGVLEYKLLTASNSDQLKLFLLLNPTLSAPLTYSAGTGALEYAFGNGTITVSSVGTPLNVGFSTQISTMETQSLKSNFLTWLGSTLDNTMDQIILAGMPITATITTHSALTLKEL